MLWFLFGFLLVLGRGDATYLFFSFFKFYVMYHLIFNSPILQIWQSTNGWRVNVIRGKFSSRSRYPAPGSKRWYAMLP